MNWVFWDCELEIWHIGKVGVLVELLRICFEKGGIRSMGFLR